MAEKKKSNAINLLSNPSRIETPFIKIVIGDYTFGVYDKASSQGIDSKGVYTINKIKYPNYVQSLNIEKVNGVVNKYTLNLIYPVTEADDPNFFYKVFSSVSQTRKIIFSYGDITLPTYSYRDEEAIILKVKQRMDASSSKISYTVSAVSTGQLVSLGSFSFATTDWTGKHKASQLIKKLLFTKEYGLQEVFYGMSDKSFVEMQGLIPETDREVEVEAKTNISPIDYLLYLVNIMKPQNPLADKTMTGRLIDSSGMYTLICEDDISGSFKGPYFKIVFVSKAKEMPMAYEIDIGYPSQNIVTSFDVEDDEGYTIFYDFFEKLNTDQYVQRINDRGELEEVYAPILGSDNAHRTATEAEKTWWSRVTEFPIKAKITIKGLLRPAILMTHVRLNVYFYGRKHLSSGLYVITKQVDNISDQGFRTTLSLLRVGAAETLETV